jgi:DNA-binding NtrC family response regulator
LDDGLAAAAMYASVAAIAAGDTPLPTVLIVEDEPLVRLALQEYLADNGFATLEAANAGEAMDLIKRSKLDIDLVFTDVRMPGEMDGLGLSRWVHSELPNIPVIVASGFPDVAETVKGMGEQFCAKPYQLDDVVTRIRANISARRLALQK